MNKFLCKQNTIEGLLCNLRLEQSGDEIGNLANPNGYEIYQMLYGILKWRLQQEFLLPHTIKYKITAYRLNFVLTVKAPCIDFNKNDGQISGRIDFKPM